MTAPASAAGGTPWIIALIVVGAVLGYLLIGVVGSLTWLPPEMRDDPTERGMAVLFAPPIGLLMGVVVTCDAIGKGFVGLVTLLGRAVPHGR